MKKIFLILCLFCGMTFALTDTDADGVSDEKDVCPRVYSRSASGCPTLTASTASVIDNACLSEQVATGKMIATIVPLCDKKTAICPVISRVTGFQSCDPIFPIIFDKNRLPMIRGAIFIVDYTK